MALGTYFNCCNLFKLIIVQLLSKIFTLLYIAL